ncbi:MULTISPECIES: MaoC/PaaZ C-terminal domain-containing protein [unclassified Variovorax]|uniref:MaoC/PaaZ C-terminal domain-containing protein n=1 Tax=unclassified Variovorax TaxID=663243 RepID=UPI0008B72916|nr:MULTISPECIES: MaoC/PaaZ C-terminal domain-containing protein [unclassified Variovorax]SEK16247.1 Acyl dehydratase [Variovorax sp. OK202]SFE42877.1 Acyl dehydratase [Variovorax sp. OK212]
MIDPARLKAWAFADISHSYTADDSMRYALALGLGRDPTDAAQLKFVDDTATGMPLALPTLAVVLGFPGSWMQDPATGIDFAQIVHGEEKVVWHRPLPAAGTVVARHRVTRIVDKGPGRGATVTYDKELFDAASGQALATVTHTTFARGNGGFATEAAPGDAAPEAPAPVPQRAPDIVVDIPTLPQQALLYRLCADRNPLHSDPGTARAAGFERPILHGLCTWGMAGHAVLAHACGNEPARLRSLFARFSAPVFPGETLRIEMHREGPHDLHFRARVPARDRTVLDHGHARIDA